MILAKEKYDYYDLEQISRPRRKVKKIRKFKYKKNPRIIAVGIVLALFICGLFLAARYAQIAATGYQINTMNKQLTALQGENDQLQVQVQKLESLDRIEKVAVGELGMQNPNQSEGIQFLAVEPSVKGNSGNTNKQIAQKDATSQKQQKKEGLMEAFANLIGSWKGDTAKTAANLTK